MSQKSALPSTIAACRSLMKSAKLAGSGTGTVFSGARPSACAELTTGYPLNVAKTPAISIVAIAPTQRQPFRRKDLRHSVTMNIVAEPFALDCIVRPPLKQNLGRLCERAETTDKPLV